MLKKIQVTTLAASLALALPLALLPACEKGPMEDAGEAVDDAVEDAGEAMEEAGDDIKDATDGE